MAESASGVQLLIISGLSGSGKTVALHALEDLGFYCVDNLPAALIPQFAAEIRKMRPEQGLRAAVGIDVRNLIADFESVSGILENLESRQTTYEIFFLQADDQTLIQRFGETRRPHPLMDPDTGLASAIRKERKILEPLASRAGLLIDTSSTNIHQLRRIFWKRFTETSVGVSLNFMSFGFKYGVPTDIDYLFDLRCLPNPHWHADICDYTGRDSEVRKFLESHVSVVNLRQEIYDFLSLQIPRFAESGRPYLTVGLGCTGGKHRSVYIAEQLARSFNRDLNNVIVHHRELE